MIFDYYHSIRRQVASVDTDQLKLSSFQAQYLHDIALAPTTTYFCQVFSDYYGRRRGQFGIIYYTADGLLHAEHLGLAKVLKRCQA